MPPTKTIAELREMRRANADAGARNGVHQDDQTGLFDRVIENSKLEAALEDRETRKGLRASAQAKFKEADETAKGIIATLELEVDDVVRVGRFKITRHEVQGRSVAFETDPSERLTITLLDQ